MGRMKKHDEPTPPDDEEGLCQIPKELSAEISKLYPQAKGFQMDLSPHDLKVRILCDDPDESRSIQIPRELMLRLVAYLEAQTGNPKLLRRLEELKRFYGVN